MLVVRATSGSVLVLPDDFSEWHGVTGTLQIEDFDVDFLRLTPGGLDCGR
jgi:hypothetical protein